MTSTIPSGSNPGVDDNWRVTISPPGRLAFPRIGDLFESWEVLLRFARRDITLRYRQTALGVLWVLLQPLLGAGVLSFVFGRVAKLPTGGLPPLLYVFTGLLAWNVFSGVVSRGSASLVGNAALVSKVYFPRMLIPISTAGSAICDFLVSTAFLGVLLGIYGVVPGPAVLLTPVWLVLIVCLALGIALCTSSLMVTFRDVAYVLPFLLQLLLYGSPIAYSLGAIPHRYHLFFQVNPITWLLSDMRWSLLGQPGPSGVDLLLSVIVPLIVLIAGSVVFEKRERGFADII